MNREGITALFRLLVGIGLLVLASVFVRACLSPPQLPVQPPGEPEEKPYHYEEAGPYRY